MSEKPLDLNDIIAAWDGKSVDTITRIYDTHSKTAEFGSELINCLGDPDSERGVTWLIKHHLEQGWITHGSGPEPDEVGTMVKALSVFTHWEARLHVLQCLDHLDIPQSATAPLAAYLETAITDTTKFVRAWAYHGWYVLAEQHPAYRARAVALLEAAQSSESAASVKVRIRRALQNIARN